MSGRRIDDHAFFGGRAKDGDVLPEGNKVKTYMSAEGAGDVGSYEDTTEKIYDQQKMSDKKIKSHSQKPLHRY